MLEQFKYNFLFRLKHSSACRRTSIFSYLILFTFQLSFGTVLLVPDDYSTIQAGLDNADEEDTVQVAEGIYFENLDWPNIHILSLFGESRETTIIDGTQSGSVIDIDLPHDLDSCIIFIQNFTLTNGYNINGGGIKVDYSSNLLEFEFINVIIRNNES